MPRARAAIRRALELDNTSAEAHNALAELKYQYDFDWSGAEEHFKQAINLNPNVAYIRLAHGWYRMCVGNFEQADAELEKAQQLDSRSLDISRVRGMLLFYERQYDKAIKHDLTMREVEPKSHRTNWYMSDGVSRERYVCGSCRGVYRTRPDNWVLKSKRDIGIERGFSEPVAGRVFYVSVSLWRMGSQRERRPFRPSFAQESDALLAIRIPPSSGSKEALKSTTLKYLNSKSNLRTTTATFATRRSKPSYNDCNLF